jgi:anoctamin-10
MEEVEKEDHESFDDFLEMIITFGYITMFATAFPLASTIAVIFIYFESRSDIYKLEKLSRRPVAHKTNNIGTWIYVLEFLAFLSIFTNIILFTYASD